nr:MAG TPA: hypothetical protein [Caudoviricetes sp.]
MYFRNSLTRYVSSLVEIQSPLCSPLAASILLKNLLTAHACMLWVKPHP